MQETEAFITVIPWNYVYPFIKLSDKFPRKLSFRLISPSKADTGQISKPILDKTDKANAWRTSVNQ